MKKILFISFVIIIGTILVTCSKNKDFQNKESLLAFLEEYGPAFQSFNVTSGDTTMITTQSDVEISFFPSSFRLYGNTSPEGQVTVKVKELFNPIDFMLAVKPTDSYGKPLVSAGAINIEAYSEDNKRLYLNNVQIVLKDDTIVNDMNVYVEYRLGETPYNQYVVYTDSLTWDLDTINTSISTTTYDYHSQYTAIIGNHFEWMNFDYILDTLTTTLTVNITDTDALNSVMVYVVFDSMNSVLKLEPTSPNFYFSSEFIPLDHTAKIVAFAVIDEVPYFSIMDIITLQDLFVNVDLEITTETELVNYLENV